MPGQITRNGRTGMRLTTFTKGTLLLVLLIGIGYALNGLFTKELVDQYVVNKGGKGELLFIFAGIILTGLGMSRQVIAFFAGYAFGLTTGLELSLLTSVVGCLLAYLCGFFIRNIVNGRLDKNRHIDLVKQHPFYSTLLLRLSPIGSNLLVNLSAGAIQLKLKPFILGSALGYIPQSFIFSLVGSGVNIDPITRISLGVILFLIVSLLGHYSYKLFVPSKCQSSPQNI